MSVQFHSIQGGHSTSCSLIIAGDGYAKGHLSGMAPKAQLLSYVLDTSGQDVYTVDQFLEMFLHAKEQQVDAISISWGFATADLESARFIADFLDREIASAGIVIAMAAGNNGPGVSSGLQDDYVPHHGFGVGAHISKVQARNVYNWTGDIADDVIFYSSFGPTKGGRQIPDVVSPLMTMVRGERGNVGQRFFSFGGTSSATPALVGSVSALGLIAKAKTGERLNPRLLKLAVQNTAHTVAATSSLRQGHGLIDVNAALDLYLKLFDELKVAKQDASKRTQFAYDVRAMVALDGSTQVGEGIHLHDYVPKKTVKLKLTDDSLKLIDSLVFYEPVKLIGQGDFFETQDVIALQGLPVIFDVTFKPERLKNPGTYAGRVAVTRVSDGLILTTIPVVVEIAHKANELKQILTVNQILKPLELVRRPIALTQPSQLVLRGLVSDPSGQGAASSDVRLSLIDPYGNIIHSSKIALTEIQSLIDVRTESLPSGNYELVVYRTFRQPAVLKPLEVKLALSVPQLKLAASQWSPGLVQVAVTSSRSMSIKTAKLTLDHVEQDIALQLADSHPAFARSIKGYYGESDLGAPTEGVELRLTQTAVNAAIRPMANVELVALDKNTSDVLYRGWKNFNDPTQAGPSEAIGFAKASQSVVWLAYPNIVNWKLVGIDSVLNLNISQPLAAKVTSTKSVPTITIVGGESFAFDFEISQADQTVVKPGIRGKIEFLDATDKVVESLPVRW